MPDNDTEGKKIDPPDNQGGGGAAVASIDVDEESANLKPIDPPDNQGGG